MRKPDREQILGMLELLNGGTEDGRAFRGLVKSYRKAFGWIGECEYCKKGLVAVHGRDRFCSARCRAKWHAHTERGRAWRAVYMRKYRGDRKEREMESEV